MGRERSDIEGQSKERDYGVNRRVPSGCVFWWLPLSSFVFPWKSHKAFGFGDGFSLTWGCCCSLNLKCLSGVHVLKAWPPTWYYWEVVEPLRGWVVWNHRGCTLEGDWDSHPPPFFFLLPGHVVRVVLLHHCAFSMMCCLAICLKAMGPTHQSGWNLQNKHFVSQNKHFIFILFISGILL